MGRRARTRREALRRARLHLAGTIRARWAAARPAPPPRELRLEEIRRRLEILVAAIHGRPVEIEAIEEPRVHGILSRAIMRLTRPLWERELPSTDGERVRLPARLPIAGGERARALARYRLLALEQAERVVRRTPGVAASLESPLVRDLFLLRESQVIDARLAMRVHGIGEALRAERHAALAARPPIGGMGGADREVERLAQEALALDPHEEATLGDETPAESLQWARETAARVAGSGRYRGVRPVAHWGTVRVPTGAGHEPLTDFNPFAKQAGLLQVESRRAERDAPGPQSDVADPDTLRGEIPDERGAAALEGADDGGGIDAAPLDPADEASRPQALDDPPVDPTPGVLYPEWRQDEGRYRPKAVTVRERPADRARDGSGDEAVRRHAALLRRVRERFEPLRAQRLRLGQQRDGEELDIPASVQALIDARTGHTPSDRLYVSVRPARRGMAICLLVDVSGSTDLPVAGGTRVIDVEKTAVLLASEAFDALGDRYAVLTFSSRGAADVRVTTIKDFTEPNGATVRDRVAAMAPSGNTRLGAAVRHAAARLAQQPAGRRLLLILSDGRPNDVDYYHEAFGVEDARQAVNEARAQGTFPFCLTVDRDEGPEYLSRVFGPAGHTILRDPAQLPMALVRVVRQLLAR